MKKVLLDENLPRRLKTHFSTSLEVTTVHDMGWQSKRNGELLSAMDSEGITFLVTADRNLQYQQDLSKFQVTVIVLKTFDIRLETLIPFVDRIEHAIVANNNDAKLVEVDLRV